jgi:hypothetical protein
MLKEEGSSATDSLSSDVTDVTDVRKKEEGRRKREEGRGKKLSLHRWCAVAVKSH